MSRSVERAFRKAVADGIFSSADILVAKNDEILFQSCYGDVREETCFDIASLTKPFATTTIAMALIAEDLLKYSDTIYQWLAGARQPAHKKITVKHLLNHTGGIPAWQPYYRELPISLTGTEAGKQLILENCYNEPLEAKPGEKTIYSDIGFIILGEILEQAGEATLDELFSQMVARPLGLKKSFFMPLFGVKLSQREEIGNEMFAPTEDCPWRERVIRGEVHDQNAYALGGVAGHAGLFSNSRDINTFISEIVKCYNGKSDWLPQNIVREFLRSKKEKPVDDEYVLGWCRPSRRNSSSGHHFSRNAVGHLGYSGCSMWIDLDKDFRIILLTNRIHPSTTNQRIRMFRPMIHDLIYDELIGK